jgi:release factor glutamine methyltransferase
MPTIRKVMKDATSRLTEAGIDTARLDARVLLEHVLGVDHTYMIVNHTQLIKKVEIAEFKTLLERREQREPVATIVGHREFWSMDFKTSRFTLDPRPDSETLIDAVMRLRPNRAKSYNILDLGTGTGCLLLSLLSEYPAAQGVAVDVSKEALEIAGHNAKELGLNGRTEFVESSWGEKLVGKFDIIITNPPYIPTADIAELEKEVTEYDPHRALDGGTDGLDEYRKVIPDVKRLLAPEGLSVIEFGEGQHDDVIALCEQAGLSLIKTEKDLAGIIRCVVVEN